MAVPKKKRSFRLSKQIKKNFVLKKTKKIPNTFSMLLKLFFSLKKKKI